MLFLPTQVLLLFGMRPLTLPLVEGKKHVLCISSILGAPRPTRSIVLKPASTPNMSMYQSQSDSTSKWSACLLMYAGIPVRPDPCYIIVCIVDQPKSAISMVSILAKFSLLGGFLGNERLMSPVRAGRHQKPRYSIYGENMSILRSRIGGSPNRICIQ